MPTDKPARPAKGTPPPVPEAPMGASTTAPQAPPVTNRQRALGPARARGRLAASSTTEASVPISQQKAATEGAPAAVVARAPAYMLAIRMDRLCVIDGHVCPIARKLSLSDGVNGVEVVRDTFGRVTGTRTADMEADAISTGWTPLPFLIDGTSYLKRITTTGGYISRWESVHPGSERITSDPAGYAKFWLDLMDAEIIERPPLWALNVLADKLRGMADQAEMSAKGVKTKKLEKLKAQHAVVLAEIEAYEMPAPLDAESAVPALGAP